MVKVGADHDVLPAETGIAALDKSADILHDAVARPEELIVRFRAIGFRRAHAMECRAKVQVLISASNKEGGGIVSSRAGLAAAERGAGEDSDIRERPRLWTRCECRLTGSEEEHSAGREERTTGARSASPHGFSLGVRCPASICCSTAAAPSNPPSPIDSTAVLGTTINAPFSFSPSYRMFIARRCSAVGFA